MKKIILTIITAILVLSGLSAQNIFFPTKEGLKLVYANKNGKGKIESYIRQTIKKVDGTAGNLTISYMAEILDKNMKSNKSSGEMTYKIIVRNGVMTLDMKSMLGDLSKSGMGEDLEITGISVEIPSDMQPGQSLKDAEMNMNMGFIKAKILITEGKCLSIEDITVPAGTFKCYKITQTTNSSMMGIKSTIRTISWYSPGVGVVKSESYDKKDKLQSGIELQSIEK